jgi:hypothetical protein
MDENIIHRVESEKKENELIYSDNHIPNYEEQACCSNFFSSFGNNNIFGYINDVCFKDIPINDQEIIDNININQEIKTPLCSSKKKITPDDEIIINNNNNINNQNIIRNSLASNPSNDSAAEPIIPLRRTNTGNIEKDKDNNIKGINNSKTNFFTNLANIFRDLFGDKQQNDENNDISDKQSNNSNNILENIKRPVLRRILTNDKSNKNRINKNKSEIKNSDKKNSYKEEEKEIFFDDILNLNLKISENNDEDLTKLVSAIPAFIVKEKNKNKDSNNKYCPICLGEYMIGEKESSLPCLHCFHSNCIEKWLKRSKFCPVCKLTISWESLDPKFENDLV